LRFQRRIGEQRRRRGRFVWRHFLGAQGEERFLELPAQQIAAGGGKRG